MENMSGNKVHSKHSHVQHGLYLEHGNHVNSAKKLDRLSASCLSSAPTENVSTNAFSLLRAPSILGSPFAEGQPIPLRDANYLTPDKSEAETKPNSEEASNQTTPSLDFSSLTAAEFGITPESFTKRKEGESRSLLKKFRRRSTIGLRGSPENNSLIRYIAYQKRTRKQEPSWQASPFKHRNVLLKEKMAAFQSSFKPLGELQETMIHTPTLFKKADTRQHVASRLCQEWPSARNVAAAVAENLNNTSTNGNITSVCDIVSEGPPLLGTTTVSKAIPVLQPNIVETWCLSLLATPTTDISEAAQGIQSQQIDEELSNNTAARESSKRVRFAEKQSLEIFDGTKPPITPLQKGHFSSNQSGSYLRSALKKTPVKITEDMKEHLNDINTREGREARLDFKSCGPLQIEVKARPTDEMEVHSKDLDSEVQDMPSVDTPVHRGVPLSSPPGSRNDSSPTRSPIKQPLSPPNFDNDNLMERSLQVVPTTECAVNSNLEETNPSSPEPQATCSRITRSSAKKKCVIQAEETGHSLRAGTQSKRVSTSKIPTPREVPKAKTAARSAPKKTPASRQRAFGKRRRGKKVQKALYGQRETVSQKPFLSPIPEMREETSFASSYQSTPKLQESILDGSVSSDVYAQFLYKTAEKENGVQHSTEEDCSSLNSSLNLVKEDTLPVIKSSSSSQLQDTIVDDLQNKFSCNSPENNFPANLKAISEREQVLKNNFSASETETQKELGWQNLHVSPQNASRGPSLLTGDSATAPTSKKDSVNLKSCRRSRRISCCLPNAEAVQSETPGNNSCVPTTQTEGLSPTHPTGHASGLLNYLQFSTGEPLRGITDCNKKKVRRSMRQLKDAESEGLGWIHIPIHDSRSQVVSGSAREDWRQMCSCSPPEPELLCQKQESRVQVPLPMKEAQERAAVAMGHRQSRGRRKTVGLLCPEENKSTLSSVQRNRRASLGYKSDRFHQRDSEMRK